MLNIISYCNYNQICSDVLKRDLSYSGDPVFQKMSKDVAHLIFRYLSPWEQVKVSRVCKSWHQLIFAALEAKYPHELFPEEKFPVNVIDLSSWIHCFGKEKLGELGIDLTDAAPNKRAAIARLARLYTLAKIEENAGASLLTKPKGLTLNKFLDLIKERLKDGPTVEVLKGFLKISDYDCLIEKTCIEVLTNNVLDESRDISIEDQEALLKTCGCELPRVLSVVSLAMLTYIISETILFEDKTWNNGSYSSTRCQERYGHPLIAGGFLVPNKVFFIQGNPAFAYKNIGAAGSVDVPIIKSEN